MQYIVRWPETKDLKGDFISSYLRAAVFIWMLVVIRRVK